MLHQFKNRNFYLVMGTDLVIFITSLLLAYAVRYAFNIPGEEWRHILLVLPFVLLVKGVIFMAAGVYRGMWRYTSILDALRLGRAAALSTLVLMTGLTLANSFEG